MKRLALLIAAFVITSAVAPAMAEKIEDPTPNALFSDTDGNKGYVEVAAQDGALLRACNENPNTPGGDDLTGYVWVNPNGEGTPPTYGNSQVGAGDADGSDGIEPRDGDGDSTDDCAGNTDDAQG